MATQHVAYLRSANSNVEITVWTANASVWKQLGDDRVQCSPIVSSITSRDFDLCIFDWVSAGEDLLAHLRDQMVFSIVWPSWGANPLVLTEVGQFERFELPAGTNQPSRVGDLYRALEVKRPVSSSNLSVRSGNKLVFQPFASIRWKSLPSEAALTLVRDLSRALRGCAKLVLPLPPRHSSEELIRFSQALRRAITDDDVAADIEFADSLSLSSYIDLIRGAALVVGPDSSSQHIAARCGVPCISLYPPKSGYNYFFFGPQEGKNLQLRLSGGSDEKALSRAVVFLANRLLERDDDRLSPSTRASIIKAAQALVDQLISIEAERSLEPQALSALTDLLNRSLPTELDQLRAFLTEEFATVWKEAQSLLDSQASPEQLQIVRQRARSLNASRIINTLCF
ncbi:hypothetical protein ACM42_08020 [Bradyrhizobium sp. CCBAU 25338]|nr:hypothetical protein [Bradyrhizobium sp. CCBAU 25338]